MIGDDQEARIPVLHNEVPKGRKVRVGEHIRHKYRLSQVSRSATRPDMRANAHTVRGDSILIGQCWSRGVSQVLTVLIKKENRAQRSWSVSLNQESDTRQDIVERRPDEDHLERVEHRFAGESVRVDGRGCRCLILDRG